jgi:hypothetical protein
MNKNNSKPLKDAIISVRITSALRMRLAKLEQRTGLAPAPLMEMLLKAACDCAEQTGEIRLPFRLVPNSKLAADQKAA